MRIIAKGTLERYGRKHGAALEPLRAWHELVKRQTWGTPNDIKRSFPSASFVGGDRVVFNIKGNAYRLVARVRYKTAVRRHGIVFIVRIMTHAEYDKVDVTTLRYDG